MSDVYQISEADALRLELIDSRRELAPHKYSKLCNAELEDLQKQRMEIELRMFKEWGVEPEPNRYEIDTVKRELRPIAKPTEEKPQPHLVNPPGKKKRA